ncbi:MAG: hypothetical protein AAFX80_03520 [Cyanobacteria bacterium J06639_18]
MLTAIILAITAFAVIGLATVAILNWNFIVNWFRERSTIKHSDKDNIAFTIQEKIKNQEFKTVQGIFNTRTNEVVDAQEINSKSVDEKIEKLHRDNELVIYE